MKKILTLLFAAFALQMSAQCLQKLSNGASYTSVIKADGTLWAWGRNNFGQLGNGTTTNTGVKTQVGTGTDWQRIDAGSYHTIGIKSDNSLWIWGLNGSGQLGNGTTTNSSVPIQIAGSWQTVVGGADHTVGIKLDGSLWAWGLNDFGQLGDGTTTTRTTPTLIASGTDWQSVAVGSEFTLAIKTDGTLWSWGKNISGQLGDGTNTDKYSPVQVGTDTNWQSVAGGTNNTLAIKTDGTLWVWGGNLRGQLGDGTSVSKNVPTQIGTDNNWQSVDAGFFFGLALKTNGTLWSCGWGTFYSLGLGDSNANVDVWTQVGAATDWQMISTGEGSLFGNGIKTDGTFWAWGYNNYSQLGDGNTVSLHIPTFITCPASTSLTEVACDSYTWAANGTTYTESGIYIDAATNNDLQLTINNSMASTATEIACETYTWIANGQTYTESGTYTHITTNAAGCTDTATLNLTVGQNTTSSVTEVACDTYTWAVNGTTYTEGGTYTHVTTDVAGCTATATLNVTINQSTSSSVTETACDSYLWAANGTTYTSGGTYTNITTNAAGCVDTETLNLTIVNSEAPTGSSIQTVAANATIADIVISPSTVIWYASESDAIAQINPLTATTILTNDTIYYAVNTTQGCPSAPFAVTVFVALATDSFDNANFSLHPNPTLGLLFIESSIEITSINVVNLLGQLVISKSINANEGTIDISMMPSGTYLVKVNAGDSVKTTKVIKL